MDYVRVSVMRRLLARPIWRAEGGFSIGRGGIVGIGEDFGDGRVHDRRRKTAAGQVAGEAATRDVSLETPEGLHAPAGEAAGESRFVDAGFGEALVDRRVGQVAVDPLLVELGAERATALGLQPEAVPNQGESERLVVQVPELAAAAEGRGRGVGTMPGSPQASL